MPYTDEDVRIFAEAWKRRMAESRAGVEARRRRLEERLPRAAELLRALGAERVWLVGSLAWGLFDERSDVDLAVRGLPAERDVESLDAVEKLLGARVDLIRVETVDAAFARRIEQEGHPL